MGSQVNNAVATPTGTVEPHTELTEWVVSAQQGDKEAFECLMQRTVGLARKTAFPLVGRDQVDDVVQEAFLVVYRKLHFLQKPEAFQAWLSRIVIHTCYAMNKKFPLTLDAVNESASADPTEEVAVKLDLRKALALLGEEDRNVLVLREFLKFSYDEVAYVTRLPVGTVRSKLHYGRKKLREMLAR